MDTKWKSKRHPNLQIDISVVSLRCGAVVNFEDILLADSNPDIEFSGEIIDGKPIGIQIYGEARRKARARKIAARSRIARAKLKSPLRKSNANEL